MIAPFAPSPRGCRSRPSRVRHPVRAAAVSLATLLAVAIALLAPAVAGADTSSSLTVIGTSDVSDSGLIPNLIGPAFEKLYPQYTFKYIGTATGTAIAGARSGAQGASVLIVHAASLENQFVADGYSYERYGRALFTNDFVLAGPKADPAGVVANASHNIAQALADVASSGANGKATFVSRGGTPGTTVQEHKLWALVSSSGLAPSSLLLCTVNSTNGGGETPIAAGNGVTSSGQPCPGGGALPTGSQLPPWYAVTGLTQGPNVQNANACNGYKSGSNSCYVFTDRGTYDYLSSGTDPAGSIPNLEIVTRDQTPSHPGGAYALVNYFHGYIINPSKPGETVNLTAAKDFLNLITSPLLQGKLKTYLATSDPGGPPFKADASPLLTASRFPHNATGGRGVTITGTLTNAEPGYPVLAGKPVTIDEIQGSLTIPVAHGRTSATGSYRIRFMPPSSGRYEVVTPQIAQIENSTLSPVFGDLLSPAATAATHVTVHGALTSVRARDEGGKALVLGSVTPGSGHLHGVVTVSARPQGSHAGFRTVGRERLASSQGNFALLAGLAAGGWQLKVSFSDRGQIASMSRQIVVSVSGAAPGAARIRSARVHGHVLSLSATLSPASSSGTTVTLVGMNGAAGTPARLGRLLTVHFGGGVDGFSLRVTLRRGTHYLLQLAYLRPGQAAVYSTLRTVST